MALKRPLPNSADVVIIGAGYAGAATACALVERGVNRVVLLEAEAIPGYHASGRNASFVLTTYPDPLNSWLARETLGVIADAERRFGVEVPFNRCGYLAVATDETRPELEQLLASSRAFGLPVQALHGDQVAERAPLLRGSRFNHALFNPIDGVVDIHALLLAYLNRAKAGGAQICYRERVSRFKHAGRRIVGVVTSGGTIHTELVVNAAGAWAGTLGALADAREMPLNPCRRHLVTTPPMPTVLAQWPMVWTIDNQFYFRPESSSLLLSCCDQTPVGPGKPTRDPRVVEILAERITGSVPELASLQVQHAWACVRTLTPDNQFIIGPDPRCGGFFWVAGLGGHGVSGSGVLGEIAADLILDQQRVDTDLSAFSPRRFAVM